MKLRRFLAGFFLGWLGIGTIIFFASGGWAGSGLTGIGIGIVLGWMNVDRAEDPWTEYVKQIMRSWH